MAHEKEALVNTNHASARPGQDDAFDAGYEAAWSDAAYDVVWPLVARVARYVNPDELAHLTGRAIAIGESHQTAPPTNGRGH
jgi:hypothetical protein